MCIKPHIDFLTPRCNYFTYRLKYEYKRITNKSIYLLKDNIYLYLFIFISILLFRFEQLCFLLSKNLQIVVQFFRNVRYDELPIAMPDYLVLLY